ncbi:leupaxin [Eurytemora carolleeae]|uniref:leupaxin n=1 Tax=Eurytemora carolleeae TaxID=1294199 RepID=UPI000C76AAEA|nr:leupaxin [Eurytemora carolleeae]|eukprot:XP_023345728.1 leupaxin-like [Eurytemora affinis]
MEEAQELLHCSACLTRIDGRAMKAGDKYWHDEHFLCSVCGIRLKDTKVYLKNQELFCENDYKKFVPRCASCSGFILKDCIRAMNQTFHPEHFHCFSCQTPFKDGEGFHEFKNSPYCKNCYIERACEKCHGCCRPITDTAMKAMNNSWHGACFRCKECGVSFEGKKNFYSVEGEAVCGECIGTIE